MPANVTVLYPNRAQARFDMAYYLERHMPMVQDRLREHGMTAWRVVRFEGATERVPFCVMATLDFDTMAGLKVGLKAQADHLLADVPSFTDLEPVFLTGQVQSHV